MAEKEPEPAQEAQHDLEGLEDDDKRTDVGSILRRRGDEKLYAHIDLSPTGKPTVPPRG